ncbi:MAG: DNA polymerase III subunit beta [Bacilli bacterium]|nr:DNA polymerase III subunit beta [Bacilli bacterium]MBR3119720.1 DNA polymerase III subunit beta [Oceanobacillus sp.]
MSTAVAEKEIVELNEQVEDSLKTKLEVEIRKDVMQSILKRLDRSREKNGVLPIKQGIYIFFDKDKIVGRAMNGDFTTEVVVAKDKKNFAILDGTSGGAVFMDPKLVSMVNSLPRKNIKLSINGGDAVLSAGRSKFELKILDHLEYPAIFNELGGVEVKVHPDVLRAMYRNTTYATSTNEVRPFLTGVNHKLVDRHLVLAATDAHRLAQMRYELDKDFEEVSKIVPAPSLNEVQKQLDDTVSSVTLHIKDKEVIYVFSNGVTIRSRVIDHNFPDTDRLVPEDCVTEVSFLAGDLQSLVKRAMLVDQENSVKLLIRAEDRQMRMVSREADKSGFEEDVVPLRGQGKDIRIGFNIRYLMDALSHYDAEEQIKLQFISFMKPFLIRTENGDDRNLDLILPVQLPDKDAKDAEVTIDNFKADIQIDLVEDEKPE